LPGFCRESGHCGDKAAAVLCGYWYFHEWTWFALLLVTVIHDEVGDDGLALCEQLS